MKTKTPFLLAILFTILSFLVSCSDKNGKDGENPDPDPDPIEKGENAIVNEWIYDEMEFKYYWNEEIPAKTSLNFNINPDDFFYNTLYAYNTINGDRFSYLEKDGVTYSNPNIKSGGEVVANELGFEYYTVFFSDLNAYCVTYVKKGTEAEKAKLKRGDLIYEVNNQEITDSNWRTLLSSGATKYDFKIINRIDLKEVTINTTKDYKENPVYYHDIILTGGKKIGYVVYNFFANDSGDKSKEYAIEMNNVFNKFKTAKIDELVLDLRYNPGGYVESGNYIASAIVPNRGNDAKKIYTTREFNKTYDTYLKKYSNYDEIVTEYFSDRIESTQQEISRLEMTKLYVITSQYTASASEQIINGLSPYINVQIIGYTTTGKNMESFEIKNEENEDITWILHPLTSKSFNSKGFSEYQSGFTPTIGWVAERVVNEKWVETFGYDNDELDFHQDENGNPTLYQLGDPNEYLLSKAIAHITGKMDMTTRSSKKTLKGKALGSSIERKPNHMIIESK